MNNREHQEQHLDDEFSPEFIAAARAHRAEVHRKAGIGEPHLSTGPRTSEGKAISSRNSFKHGLASGEIVVAGEDPLEFDTHLQALLLEHQPADHTEHLLVNEMAQSWWLMQRAGRLQADCFANCAQLADEKQLALFLRYRITYERAFYKALNTLTKLQKERRKLSPERHERPHHQFVSQRACPKSPAPVKIGVERLANCPVVGEAPQFVSQKLESPSHNPELAAKPSQSSRLKVPDAARAA
ncbi:MAG TPA: hypothetical protein VHZ55_17665 [Bryobacteraceae bacterium]|nr:hypothetical protein [Bryobacteraceae bacterium]